MKDKKEKINTPFLLQPAGKDYLWGGRRLKDDYGKNFDLTPLAETWECSTHPDGISRAKGGFFDGQNLTDILIRHPELEGTHPLSLGLERGQIPILVKFIDAARDLSVQVHPDDDYAREHEGGQLGKTEMWYVVDAQKDAKLIYGLNRTMTSAELRRILESGNRIEHCLQKVPVKTGDVFYIRAGTIHAICKGALIVEVQESSNLTYRLYDYHRKDKNGRERQLHIDKALEVADLHAAMTPRQPMHVTQYRPGAAEKLLCRCRYFEVRSLSINTERTRQLYEIQTGPTSFQIFICTKGCGVLFWHNGAAECSLPFFQGDTVFISASSVPIRIQGKASALRIHC